MKKGFTLIELMIVVAIIAIIAAIAIPSLLRARQAANEGNAAAACKQMTSHESVFKRTDADGNGVQDYWTKDVAAFYAMPTIGGTKLKFIDISFAKADFAPLAAGSNGYAGTPPAAGAAATVAKAGYYYRAMLKEVGGVLDYSVDTSPLDGIDNAYNHMMSWAFCAFPAGYGKDGVRIFIVNEEGVVFAVDNDKDGVNAYGLAVTTWPHADPPTQAADSGNFWGTVE